MNVDDLPHAILEVIAECGTPGGKPAARLAQAATAGGGDGYVFAVLWTFTVALSDMYKETSGHNEHRPGKPFRLQIVAPDQAGALRAVDVDEATPGARAFGRWLLAALNDDVETGAAVINTVTGIENITDFHTRLIRFGTSVVPAYLARARNGAQ